MSPSSSGSARFFVAMLPPQPLLDEITAVKQDIWQRFGSKAALRSPPHITLQPPFEWPLGQVGQLEKHLVTFAQSQISIPVRLEGFNAFAPRVLYIDVAQTGELMAIQSELMAHLEATCGIVDRVAKIRSFTPHVTVGFRDLAPAAFHQAWAEFCDRPFIADFVAENITLFHHDGQMWQIASQFPLRPAF